MLCCNVEEKRKSRLFGSEMDAKLNGLLWTAL